MAAAKLSQLVTQTFEGTPDGMNLAHPQQELLDTEARYIQDGLVYQPGITVRRGPISAIGGVAALSKKGTGLLSTLNPLGQLIIAVLNGDGSTGNFSAYSSDYTTKVDIPWTFNLPVSPPSSPYYYVDTKPSLDGGCWVGVSNAYDANSPTQGLAYWYGGNKATYTTGTLSVTRGSKAVTGSGTTWSTNVSSGMFLFANTDDPYTNTYIGVIKSVDSNTTLTLKEPSPHTSTAKGYTLQSLRGFCPTVVKGRITSATSTTTVTGGATKFIDQGLNSGTWQLYRASDWSFIGKVSSVVTNISLTLAANATIACNNERYIALKIDGDYGILTTTGTKPGFLNARYSDFQWFANNGQSFDNTSRVWFSDDSRAEAMDFSTVDGDFLPIASTTGINTPIKAIMASYNSLVVVKENETFGVYGSSPSTFEVKKIEDDGTLSGMSVQSYGSGVIWAGREAIYLYDGVQATNLTKDKLGEYYKSTMKTFDPSKYKMYSMVTRDHYFLFVEKISPTVAIKKGNVSSTPSQYTIVINMLSGAVTLLTNTNLRGSILLPADSGQKTWFLVNDSTKGVICNANDLFDSYGIDQFGCDGGSVGPDFFFESKKYSAGDSLRKKLFKQLAMHYLAQAGDIKVDTVVGLNNVASTTTNTFPNSEYTWDTLVSSIPLWTALGSEFASWDDLILSVFVPKRVKFLKRSQHLSFRLYQSTSAMTRLILGPFQIGFKYQRAGRI